MTLRYSMAAFAALACIATPSFASVEFVTDGSFENNAGIGQFNFNTSASPWTVSSLFANGYGFVFANNSAFTTGSPGQFGSVALYGTTADGTDEGNDFFGVDSTFHPSILSQTISGLTIGDRYTLTFDWAAGQQRGFSGVTTDFWQVAFGSQTQVTPTATNPSGGFTGWMSDTMTFVATGTTQSLSFTDIGTCVTNPTACGPTVAGGPPFSLLDSVSLTTGVPEPSTWAMMILGFVGLGYAALRSRRTPVSIA